MPDDPSTAMQSDAGPGAARGEDAATAQLVERLVAGLARRLNGTVDEIEIAREGLRLRLRRGGTAGATSPALFDARHAIRAGQDGATGGGVLPASAASAAAGSGPPVHPAGLPHPARPPIAQPTGRAARSGRVVVTAPAVGIYLPRGDVAVGARVRAGDRLGVVDLLGVPQDVVAAADGVLTGSLVEAGEGVEYGQELLVIEATS